MKKVAFIVGPALGHISRAYVIARALFENSNVEIDFLCPDKNGFTDRVLSDRFKSIPLPCESGVFQFDVYPDAVESVISKERYDALCVDLNPSIWLATAKLPNIPRVMISNVYLTGAGHEDTEQTRLFDKHGTAINAARARRGLPELGDPKQLYDGDRVILADPNCVVNEFAPLPEHFRPCGPIFWDVDEPLPEQLRALKRALLISFGSTGLRQPPVDMVKRLAARIRADRVVQVGGLALDGTADGGVDWRFSWVSIWKTLEKTALAITAGGAGSTYMALAAGVPVVCFPHHENHAILGRVLERAGVAILATPDDWRAKIAELDPDELRRNCQRLSAQFDVSQAAGAAAACIGEVLC